jgi:hypothetical protein
MAVSPVALFPSNVDTSDPSGYPYGKARNISAPGAGDGTPREAAMHNDVLGFQQALLSAAGIVPSGTPDKVGASQYLQAMQALFAASRADVAGFTKTTNYYDLTDAGAAAVILTHSVATANGALVTVGPTGSGADREWLALDALPLDAEVLEVNVRLLASWASGAMTTDTPFAWVGLQKIGSVSPMTTAAVAVQATPFWHAANSWWWAQGNSVARVKLDNSNRFAFASAGGLAGVEPIGKIVQLNLRGFSR